MAAKIKRTKIYKQTFDDQLTPADVVSKVIGEHLKKKRKEQGYTNAQRFAMNHINPSTYAGWETGKDMMVSNLILSIQLMGLTPAEFFADLELPLPKLPKKTRSTH